MIDSQVCKASPPFAAIPANWHVRGRDVGSCGLLKCCTRARSPAMRLLQPWQQPLSHALTAQQALAPDAHTMPALRPVCDSVAPCNPLMLALPVRISVPVAAGAREASHLRPWACTARRRCSKRAPS